MPKKCPGSADNALRGRSQGRNPWPSRQPYPDPSIDLYDFEDDIDWATSLMRRGADPREVDALIAARRTPVDELHRAGDALLGSAEELQNVAVALLWGNRTVDDVEDARRDFQAESASLLTAVDDAVGMVQSSEREPDR